MNRLPDPDNVDALKRRRDGLLNRACTRQERPDVLAEVRAINRRIEELEGARRSGG